MPLDIGELPESATDATLATDDPERLEKLVAHLVARVADRFAIVRRFSRHMEGTEKRAGLLSDLAAAFFELYRRNPETFERLMTAYGKEFAARQKARKAQTSNGTPPPGVQFAQPTPTPGGPVNAS